MSERRRHPDRLRWHFHVDALLHRIHFLWGPGGWFCDWFNRKLLKTSEPPPPVIDTTATTTSSTDSSFPVKWTVTGR